MIGLFVCLAHSWRVLLGLSFVCLIVLHALVCMWARWYARFFACAYAWLLFAVSFVCPFVCLFVGLCVWLFVALFVSLLVCVYLFLFVIRRFFIFVSSFCRTIISLRSLCAFVLYMFVFRYYCWRVCVATILALRCFVACFLLTFCVFQVWFFHCVGMRVCVFACFIVRLFVCFVLSRFVLFFLCVWAGARAVRVCGLLRSFVSLFACAFGMFAS